MRILNIKSSNIRSAEYDEDTNQLTVNFNSGTYTYDGVPVQKIDKMEAATSAGSYLHTEIKPYHKAIQKEKRRDQDKKKEVGNDEQVEIKSASGSVDELLELHQISKRMME